jgi:hypothetical protein
MQCMAYPNEQEYPKVFLMRILRCSSSVDLEASLNCVPILLGSLEVCKDLAIVVHRYILLYLVESLVLTSSSLLSLDVYISSTGIQVNRVG